MTEKEDRGLEGQLMNILEELDNLTVIDRATKSKGKTGKKASKKRDETGLKYHLDTPFFEDGRPRYSSKGAFEEADLTEEERSALLKGGFSARNRKTLEDAIRHFEGNGDKVLRNEDGKYHTYLANISNSEEVNHNIDPKSRAIMGAYSRFVALSDLENRFSEGKITGEEEEQVRKIASQGVGRKAYKKAISDGYSEDYANTVRELAAIGTGRDYSREDVLAGFEEVRDEEKKRIEKKYGKNASEKVAEAVGKALTKMIKSGDEKEEISALNLLYKAKKGYALGEREYKDAYKD